MYLSWTSFQSLLQLNRSVWFSCDGLDMPNVNETTMRYTRACAHDFLCAVLRADELEAQVWALLKHLLIDDGAYIHIGQGDFTRVNMA